MPDENRRLTIDILMQKYLSGTLSERECDLLLSQLRRHEDENDEFNRDLTDGIWMSCLIGHYFQSEKRRFSLDLFDAGLPENKEDGRENPLAGISVPQGWQYDLRETSGGMPVPPSSGERSVEMYPAPRPVRAASRTRFGFRHLAFAALVTVVFSVFAYNEFRKPVRPISPSSFHPVAKISAAVDIRPAPDGHDFKEGVQLEAERIRFEDGTMELTLLNGVRIVLEGPVDFQLNSLMKTFCSRGRISATVPKNAVGFEIATPGLTVVDRGTRFVLDVKETDTEVHTISGLVAVDRLPSGVKQSLPEGKALRWDNGRSTREIRVDVSKFVSESILLEKRERRDEKMLEIERQRRALRSDDPALLVDLDFEPRTHQPVNRAARASEVGPLQVLGGETTAGRWRKNVAFAFLRKSDGFEIVVPNSFRSMTLSAVIRIDSLDRFNQTLLACHEEKAGSIVWQIRGDGTLQFGVRPAGGKPFLNYEAGNVFERKSWGGWYHLAVVYDAEAGRVAFYRDGRVSAVQKIVSNIPILPDRLTLGNGMETNGKATNRVLGGFMERFMIFDRALNDDEVRDLHDDRQAE